MCQVFRRTLNQIPIFQIKALQELGFKFYKAKEIKPPMVQDAVVNVECKLDRAIPLGDHTMFVGEVVSTSMNSGKAPIAYHNGKYGQVTHNIPKPSPEERERFVQIVEKYQK